MNLSDISNIYRDFSLMAFYRNGNHYNVDLTSFEPTKMRITSYFDEFDNEENGYDQKVKRAIQYSRSSFNNFLSELEALAIPADDFNLYMKRSQSTTSIPASIQKYFDIKNTFKYSLVPLLHLNLPIRENEWVEDENKRKTSSIQILNHRNPFADITIENQDFLYPDTSGKFNKLSFNVGYTMTKIESEDSAIIGIQPDFKISKSSDRNAVQNRITMDNSITTPMPENQGNLELLYI